MELKLVDQEKREDILFCLHGIPEQDNWFAGSSDASIHNLTFAGAPENMPPFQGHQSYVTSLTTASGRLWSVGYDRLLNEWDVESGRLISSRSAHQKWIRNVQASPDGSQLATVGDDMVARIWDTEKGTLIHELKGHAPQTPQGFATMLYTCAYSPDGETLATADRIGETILWDTRSGKVRRQLQAPVMYTFDEVQRLRSIGGIRSLCFSPDQQELAVGGMGHVRNVDGLGGKARIEWFNPETGEQTGLFESDTHKGLIEDIHYYMDGKHLLAAGGNNKGFLISLNLETRKAVQEPEAPMHVHQFQFNTNQNQLLAVGHQKSASWSILPEQST